MIGETAGPGAATPMFNLYQIVQAAQGGRAIANLAQQFDLSTEEANKSVNALIPALSAAFMAKVAAPGGYAEILTAMADGQHKQAYADAAAAADPATVEKGASIARSLFGPGDIAAQTLEQASRFSGVPCATLGRMMPVLVSLIVGGTAVALQNPGSVGAPGAFAGPWTAAGLQPGAAPAGFGAAAGAFSNGFPGGSFPTGGFPAMGPIPAAVPGSIPPVFQASFDAFATMFKGPLGPKHGNPSGG